MCRMYQKVKSDEEENGQWIWPDRGRGDADIYGDSALKA